jgi:hypothetical protein
LADVPRFFFDLEIDESQPDATGLEFESLWIAQREAARLLGQVLKDDPETMLRPGGLRVVVRDEYGSVTRLTASIVT